MELKNLFIKLSCHFDLRCLQTFPNIFEKHLKTLFCALFFCCDGSSMPLELIHYGLWGDVRLVVHNLNIEPLMVIAKNKQISEVNLINRITIDASAIIDELIIVTAGED